MHILITSADSARATVVQCTGTCSFNGDGISYGTGGSATLCGGTPGGIVGRFG